MKTYIAYDELTFPEVDELSRALPWLLPLGPYPPAQLEAIGKERFQGQRFGVLPALPYGWEGSRLHLPADILERIFDSLLETFQEDEWEQIVALSPVQLPFLGPREQLVVAGEPLPHLRLRPTAVVPIGHTEQHGFHLPLNTDSVIVEALAKRLDGERAEVLPVWPYGVSMHRRQFPGTLTLEPRLFEDLWVAAAGELCKLGFESVFLLNGHGGNQSFLTNVVKFCGEQHLDHFVFTTFLHTSFGKALDLLRKERRSQLMGHACELETSYMLALRPDLVRLEAARDELQFITTPNYRMDWLEDGAMVANPPWSDDTLTGTYGAPSAASRAQGERWLQAAVGDLQDLIEEALQQRVLRLQRRRQGWHDGAWRSIWESVSTSVEPDTRGPEEHS